MNSRNWAFFGRLLAISGTGVFSLNVTINYFLVKVLALTFTKKLID